MKIITTSTLTLAALIFAGIALGEEPIAPADSQSVLDAIRKLPEAERAALLKQLGKDYASNTDLLVDKIGAPLSDPNTGGTPPEANDEKKKVEPEKWSLHYQGTVVSQVHDKFHSPYESQTGSLLTEEGNVFRTSVTGTFFLGRKLWDGGELYFNPEIAGGKGFSGVQGIAGYPNGEITRVGKPAPTAYAARFFLRQTFDLGGECEDVEGGPNQLAGKRAEKHLIVTFGKMAATDVFDDNKYSHDPRGQFLNWSLMDNGAWDYPADTRGYSPGLTFEYEQKGWSVRYGAFLVVKSANGAEFDYHIGRALSQDFEFQRSYKILSKEGSATFLAYANNARMGSYNSAIEDGAANSITPDIRRTREYHTKYGFGLNLEQKILDDLGAFSRAGWNDGRTETWMFTEIDRTFSLGLSLSGNRWHRPNDQIGLAGVVNGLAGPHKDFLAAGGHGFIIGDGRLNYSLEKILETYYKVSMTQNLFLTLDYQHVESPAYNRDRGPVNIGGLRFHVEF